MPTCTFCSPPSRRCARRGFWAPADSPPDTGSCDRPGQEKKRESRWTRCGHWVRTTAVHALVAGDPKWWSGSDLSHVVNGSHLRLRLVQEGHGFTLRVRRRHRGLASLEDVIQRDSQLVRRVPHLHHEGVHLWAEEKVTLRSKGTEEGHRAVWLPQRQPSGQTTARPTWKRHRALFPHSHLFIVLKVLK